MRITTSLNYATDPRTAAAQARELEAAGVDCIRIPEAYGFDGVSLRGYLASATTTVGLASGILNTYSRTPACIAQTAAGRDALSEGRFTLGLGASGPQVSEGFHGVPYSMPLTRMKEIISICRMAWKREKLEHDGRVFTLPLRPTRAPDSASRSRSSTTWSGPTSPSTSPPSERRASRSPQPPQPAGCRSSSTRSAWTGSGATP